MSNTVLYEKVDGIAKITLNRPERGNAFIGEMITAFREALETAKKDNDIRVIVILGAGKDFCTGYDHADNSVILASEGDVVPFDIRRPDTNNDVEFWTMAARLKKPVIAGVHGTIIGSGVWLTLMCDCVVAADDTEFHNLEYAIGLNYSDLLPLIHAKIPMNIAREFAYTGYPITPEVGLRYGLYNHVVPADQVEEATMKLAHRMLRLAPYTLTMQKEIADMAADRAGMFSTIPFSKEALNVGLTFVGTPESDAYWKYGKEHTPDELMQHFHDLMNGLREADDWELGD